MFLKEGKEEVWMSHGDHVEKIPKDFEVNGFSENEPFEILGNEKTTWHVDIVWKRVSVHKIHKNQHN